MTDMSIAEALDRAAMSASPIPQLALTVDEDAAYALQAAVVQRRLERGERLTGFKMGLTSLAKMAQVNVNEPMMGRLTDAMEVPDGGTLSSARFIHPRVEPEIAFRLSRDLSGEVDVTTARAAVGGAAAAIDVLDSRYAAFKFNLADGIADNCSSSGYVIGSWQPLPDRLDNLAMRIEVDGEIVHEGSSSEILGDPLNSLIMAARLAARQGTTLKEGQIFLTGAATAAVPVRPGMTARAVVEGLGSCSLRVTE
jgi:2-oxo-3-hexenedioate decarboxylase